MEQKEKEIQDMVRELVALEREREDCPPTLPSRPDPASSRQCKRSR